MAKTVNIPSQLVVQTAAQWGSDATVYSAKRILITSDAFYGSTDQRKFKIADGVQTWSNLNYFPVSGYDDATSSIQTQLESKGFTLQGASSQNNPLNGTTHSFADANVGTSTVYNNTVRLYVPKACILKRVKVFVKVAGTLAAGGQNSVFSLVQNGVTDHDVSTTVKHDASATLVSKNDFNVSFADDDWFNYKIVHPTWGTPPTSVSYTVTAYFETT